MRNHKNFFESGLSLGSPDDLIFNNDGGSIDFFNNQHQNETDKKINDLRILGSKMLLGESSGSFVDPDAHHNHGLDFSEGNISKELPAGHSLYSGGSSLIGLNYAFGGAPVSTKPQEIFVIKVHNREIKMPKIDINRVHQMEKREDVKYNYVEPTPG